MDDGIPSRVQFNIFIEDLPTSEGESMVIAMLELRVPRELLELVVR
jgi:hypothetical protein